MLAMLAGGVMAYAADSLIIGPDGTTIVAKSINFGNRLGALLTLWNPDYVTGIQPSTFYQRSGKNFAWYKGGQHTDTELDPGGGSKMMSLTDGNLDVAGTATMSGLNLTGTATMTGLNLTGTATMTGLNLTGPASITGTNTLEFGAGISGKQGDAGKIGYQTFTGDALDVVGAGTDGTNRKIKFWAEGGATLAGSLNVSGVVDGNMKVVYQRDDEPQRTDQKPLWRYHMSLTAARYAGRTKTIPNEILTALCGKPDGCEVRLGMTRWDNDNETETASIVNRFYYSPADRRWRTNNPRDSAGIIGGGGTTHAMDAWSTCYFTDGTYQNYQDQGDKGTGMQLLVGNNGGKYNNPARTCELTIIP